MESDQFRGEAVPTSRFDRVQSLTGRARAVMLGFAHAPHGIE